MVDQSENQQVMYSADHLDVMMVDSKATRSVVRLEGSTVPQKVVNLAVSWADPLDSAKVAPKVVNLVCLKVGRKVEQLGLH